MRTFYYIAKRKPRGRRLQYAGDGLVDADTKAEARECVARRYGVSNKNVILEERFPVINEQIGNLILGNL